MNSLDKNSPDNTIHQQDPDKSQYQKRSHNPLSKRHQVLPKYKPLSDIPKDTIESAPNENFTKERKTRSTEKDKS